MERLRDLIGVPHLSLSTEPTWEKVADLAVLHAGATRHASPRAESMRAAVGGRPEAVFLRAWGAEVTRGFYTNSVRALAGRIDPEAMSWLHNPRWLSKANRRFSIVAFDAFIRRGNWAGLAAFGYDLDSLFYWEHRMAIWGSSMHAEMDVALRSIVTFNGRSLFEAALGLAPQTRLSKRPFLDVVERYRPDLAAVPLAAGDPREPVPKEPT